MNRERNASGVNSYEKYLHFHPEQYLRSYVGGKTDILVKYTDGTNLFVAECKFWKGEVMLHQTIDQLFERYLTWRDSKKTIILFVKNKDFSSVLSTIEEAIPKHQYYVRSAGARGESSFSYVFHFPTDKGKIIYTEILAFHFP